VSSATLRFPLARLERQRCSIRARRLRWAFLFQGVIALAPADRRSPGKLARGVPVWGLPAVVAETNGTLAISFGATRATERAGGRDDIRRFAPRLLAVILASVESGRRIGGEASGTILKNDRKEPCDLVDTSRRLVPQAARVNTAIRVIAGDLNRN
jgi:hypothetical protein